MKIEFLQRRRDRSRPSREPTAVRRHARLAAREQQRPGVLPQRGATGLQALRCLAAAPGCAACGTPTWPADRTVPQVSLEFDVADADAVLAAADELVAAGYEILHPVP